MQTVRVEVFDLFLISNIFNQLRKVQETSGSPSQEFCIEMPIRTKSIDFIPSHIHTLSEQTNANSNIQS